MNTPSTSKGSVKKKEKSKNPYLKSLPPSIENLSERIGLRKVPESYIKDFLRDTLPRSTSFTLDKYKEYVFSIDKFKKRKKALKSAKRKTLLNAREQRKLAVFKLDPETTTFQTFLPINALWKQYMTTMLQLKEPLPDDLSVIYQKLVKADYHGCLLVVMSSKCPSYVGARGIVIQETKNVFRLITEEHKVKTILKKGSVFCFELKERIFKIYGDNFCYVPYERVRVKYKIKQVVNP